MPPTPPGRKSDRRTQPKHGNGWERRILVSGLVGGGWLSVLATWSLTAQGVKVPEAIVMLGALCFGACAALVAPEALDRFRTKVL